MPRPPQPPSDSPDQEHVPEDVIEAYAMGKLRGKGAARVQTHLEACDQCCLKAVEIAEFIDALKQGFQILDGKEGDAQEETDEE